MLDLSLGQVEITLIHKARVDLPLPMHHWSALLTFNCGIRANHIFYLRYVVENSSGEAGLFPGNHLDPSAEFSGKALFDIERLLSLKKEEEAKKITEKATNNNNSQPTQSSDSWRFFDPLASPSGDEEMLKLEAILEEKAKKANQGLILQGLYNALNLDKGT